MTVDLKERLVLKDLLRRSDALGNAYQLVADHPHPGPASLTQQRVLGILEELHREASEEFRRYRDGLGVPQEDRGPFPR